jgi:RNA methyltransferase, TrmH family
MKLITSDSNPQYRRWLELKSSSGIKEHGLYLTSGLKLVPEFLLQRPQEIAAVIVPENKSWPEAWPDFQRVQEDFHVFQLSHPLFKELDELGTHAPLLLMKPPLIQPFDLDQPASGRELLVALQDPNNLGALIRVALAFQVNKVILLQESANPFLPKAVKASSGAMAQMPLFKGPSIKSLKVPTSRADDLLVLDSSGQDIGQFQWPKNFRLLIGEEGRGIPLLLKSAKTIAIPIDVRVESLNAITAAAIALYASAGGSHP